MHVLSLKFLCWFWAADTFLCTLLFLVFMTLSQKMGSQISFVVFIAIVAVGKYVTQLNVDGNPSAFSEVFSKTHGESWMWLLVFLCAGIAAFFCGKLFDQREWLDLDDE
jgi:hypothetical protein